MSLLAKLGKSTGPAYDIILIQHDNQTYYLLELSIAGFQPNNLSIELIDQLLIIKGTSNDPYHSNSQAIYLHKALARRDFKYIFDVNDQLTLQNEIQIIDGLLRIVFHNKQSKKHSLPIKLLPTIT